jgi:hypothetical protein
MLQRRESDRIQIDEFGFVNFDHEALSRGALAANMRTALFN